MNSYGLRGNPEQLKQILPSALRVASYAPRQDGSAKGPGYFGEVYNYEDSDFYATELPFAAFNVYGHPSMLIPAIVPTLTIDELAHLVDGGKMTWPISEKAIRHAEGRLSRHQSVFAQLDERPYPLPEKASVR